MPTYRNYNQNAQAQALTISFDFVPAGTNVQPACAPPSRDPNPHLCASLPAAFAGKREESGNLVKDTLGNGLEIRNHSRQYIATLLNRERLSSEHCANNTRVIMDPLDP